MVEFNEFIGGAREKVINGRKVNIYPLRVKELAKFKVSPSMSQEEKFDIGVDLVIQSLKDVKLTKEEVLEWDAGIFRKIADEVKDLNGLNEVKDGNPIARIKEKIARQKARIQQ